MKVIITTHHSPTYHPITWYSLPDSSVANAGKPLFLPELDSEFEAFPVIAVKISKLGKTVSEKFAHRYYHEIVPAIHFRASTLYSRLINDGLPMGIATDFDRSMITAPATDAESFFSDLPLRTLKNGIEVFSWNNEDAKMILHRAIVGISATNIIKIGDLIAPILSPAVKVCIGDTLSLMNNSGQLLRVDIK